MICSINWTLISKLFQVKRILFICPLLWMLLPNELDGHLLEQGHLGGCPAHRVALLPQRSTSGLSTGTRLKPGLCQEALSQADRSWAVYQSQFLQLSIEEASMRPPDEVFTSGRLSLADLGCLSPSFCHCCLPPTCHGCK